jgi:glycerol kinase
MLPEPRASSGSFGTSHVFGGAIDVAGIAGDQQAALFGQTCFSRGLAKNTYGTGCFMLMNIGTEATTSEHNLLTTIAWEVAKSPQTTSARNAERMYALEGSVFVGGAVVQWLRDGLGIIKSARDIEQLAASVHDSGGVYLVPAFAGLGAGCVGRDRVSGRRCARRDAAGFGDHDRGIARRWRRGGE